MISLITQSKAQRKIAENTRARRLQMGLTQHGLAERAGVALATLRKFEQKGVIALESFLKISLVLGTLEEILKATQVQSAVFSSIEDVLAVENKPTRKRGRRR